MNKTFKYDVFLSYSSRDKEIVTTLAERLKNDGLRVWLDSWVIKPGDSIPLKIQQGLEQSRTLIMCMSAAYFGSEWGALEHNTLLFRDPTNTQRRFIPLLVEDCTRPDVIAQFAYIDWRTPSGEAYAKIFEASAKGKSKNARTRAQKKANQALMTLSDHKDYVLCAAVTPDGNRIISGSNDKTLKFWGMPQQEILAEASNAARYTNAKVVLVGKTGVGKTGLALRLCEDRWEATESTHGMIVSRLELPSGFGTRDMEREV